MDSYSDHPGEYGAAPAAGADSDVSMAIGADERRMHVRAYNYWCSLLEGRDFPSIEDLEPGDIEDFGPHSVLLDFTEGRDNPATPYIGSAIGEECGIGDDVKSIADVPSRSLLLRVAEGIRRPPTSAPRCARNATLPPRACARSTTCRAARCCRG